MSRQCQRSRSFLNLINRRLDLLPISCLLFCEWTRRSSGYIIVTCRKEKWFSICSVPIFFHPTWLMCIWKEMSTQHFQNGESRPTQNPDMFSLFKSKALWRVDKLHMQTKGCVPSRLICNAPPPFSTLSHTPYNSSNSRNCNLGFCTELLSSHEYVIRIWLNFGMSSSSWFCEIFRYR
jgi:hypothetical protein